MIDPTPLRILTMNRGSSTLKSALYEMGPAEDLLLSVSIDRAIGSGSRVKIAGRDGKSLLDTTVESKTAGSPFNTAFDWMRDQGVLEPLAAAGHRLVHGGVRYREPQRISAEFLVEIEKLIPLDPDHTPAAIEGIHSISRKLPGLPQFACFDTAFHSSLPAVARRYAIPRHFDDDGIHRFGFHGLSYEYIMAELGRLEGAVARGRVIVAHLGSGASIAAIRDGKSIDTSMGFTPLEGLVMSTRSGDVDPGLLLYLSGTRNASAKDLSTLLNKQSGLLGVSGTSADMRTLLESAPRDASAEEAVDLFCYRAKKYIGSYAAALGGLDLLVFAGGIGEHAPAVRQKICDGLEFLGIELREASNLRDDAVISASGSRVKVRVVNTNEDLMIARHVVAMLR